MLTVLFVVIGLFMLLAVMPKMASNALQDAGTQDTKALPNGANTIYSTGLDTGITTVQATPVPVVEWELSAPALDTTALPDTKTMTYTIIEDDALPLDGSSTAVPGIATLVQTGAGGAGAAATTLKFRRPPTGKRYIGFKAVNSGTGDASGSSATLQIFA